jgi:hypothetical protein
MAGTIAGNTIGLDVFGVAGSSPTRPWLMPGIAAGGELFALRGPDPSPMFSPLNGSTEEGFQQNVYGVLALPRSPTGDGSIYCIGGRTARSGDTALVTVDRGALLGQCPGVAVAGELSFCTSGTGLCRDVTGTLDGVTINWAGFNQNGARDDYVGGFQL